MAPKLYGDTRSPCVRAVLLAIKALNIEVEYIPIDVVKKEHLTAEYLKINPRHTVPSLKDGDFAVWDSHAIMIYLAQKYGKNNPVYPDDPQKQAKINQMLFYEIGEIFSRHSLMTAQLLHKGKEPSQDLVEALEQGYQFLETFLKDTKYVAGNTLTLADFSFWTTISNSQVYIPIEESKFPNISKWLKLMKSLPYKDLNEGGAAEFLKLIDILRKK